MASLYGTAERGKASFQKVGAGGAGKATVISLIRKSMQVHSKLAPQLCWVTALSLSASAEIGKRCLLLPQSDRLHIMWLVVGIDAIHIYLSSTFVSF